MLIKLLQSVRYKTTVERITDLHKNLKAPAASRLHLHLGSPGQVCYSKPSTEVMNAVLDDGDSTDSGPDEEGNSSNVSLNMAVSGSADEANMSLNALAQHAVLALGAPAASSSPNAASRSDGTPTLSTISGPRVAPYAPARSLGRLRAERPFRRTIFD